MGEHQEQDRDRTDRRRDDRSPADREGAGGTDWERRRRLAEVFGEVLPETTRDERDPDGRRERRAAGDDPGDRWLKDQVPPHHG